MRRAIALVLLVAFLTACGNETVAGSGEGWARVADAPLSPRWGATSDWTGNEVLVVGGVTSLPSAPGASSEDPYDEVLVADGAAYDPAADTWRPIAEAPEPIGYWFSSVVVGNTWVLSGTGDARQHWLAYDVEADAWRTLPNPPQAGKAGITVLDGQVYTASRDDRVMALDIGSDTWSFLPRNEEQPPLDIRGIAVTDDEIVVTGNLPGDDVVTPDVWDGSRWRRLPTTGQWASYHWQWSGRHLVCLYLDPNGDGIPAGGRLDPTRGVWDRIPGEPASGTGGVNVSGASGARVVGWGWVYDDAQETWTRLPELEPRLDGPSTVVAGDRVVVVGGYDATNGYTDESGMSRDTWVLDLDDITS